MYRDRVKGGHLLGLVLPLFPLSRLVPHLEEGVRMKKVK